MTYTLKSHYPDFVPDQIVTDGQLNQLYAYLDEQDRVTRVCLVGTGVACGLRPAFFDDAVRLGGGFGVSAGGYLLELDVDASYTHYRSYQDPGSYEPWRTATQPIYELLEAAVEGASSLETDPPADNADRVLVLYFEEDPIRRRSCPVTESHEEGVDVRVSARTLLVHKDDLDALAAAATPPAPVRLAPLFLADFKKALSGWPALYNEAFFEADFEVKIPAAFTQWGAFLGLDPELPGLLSTRLIELRDDVATPGQIHHALLQDLAEALDQAAAGAAALVPCGAASLSERHLMLGALDGTEGWRHFFRPSAARDAAHGETRRVQNLFRRLAEMPFAFDPAAVAPGDVRLTPSHTEERPLGERALPGHFRPTAELLAVWRPSPSAEPLWSYHHRDTGGPGIEDLDLDAHRATFVRVEGHLGMTGEAAADAIAAERARHNVPFELLRVDLDDVLATEDAAQATIDAALADWKTQADSLRDLVAELPNGTDNRATIVQGAEDLAAAETAVQDALTPWRDLRNARPIQGDATLLHTEWAAARGELLDFASTLRGELSKSPPVVPEPAPGLTLDDVKQRMAGSLLDALFAGEADPGWIETAAGNILDATGVAEALDELALLMSRAALDSIAALLVYLPQDLRDTNQELFTWRYGHFLASLRYELLVDRRDPSQWPQPAEVRALHGKAATTVEAWDRLRREDFSVLDNLNAAGGAPTRLSGVVPGGTLVLVTSNQEVVADFSLPGRLPCRRQIHPETIHPLQPPGTLVVVVSDTTDSSPISGASVSAASENGFWQAAETATPGTYEIRELPGGVFAGAVVKNDYFRLNYSDVDVAPDGLTRLELRLTPIQLGHMLVRVLLVDGNPTLLATVTVRHDDGLFTQTLFQGQAGEVNGYSFQGIPIGPYTVTASVGGGASTGEATGVVVVSSTTTLDVQLV